MMNKHQLRSLIKRVLKDVDLYSESAEELLMLTAAVESNLGSYISQVGGPAKGIFQMEPATETDIFVNYLQHKEGLYDSVQAYVPLGVLDGQVLPLEYDLAYQIIMARIHYLRVPTPLPSADHVVGLAVYWKNYYNTHLGKGTVKKAIEKYHKYVTEKE